MSKIVIHLDDNQAEILAGLLAEKIEADYRYYSVLQPVYEACIERWTPNKEDN